MGSSVTLKSLRRKSRCHMFLECLLAFQLGPELFVFIPVIGAYMFTSTASSFSLHLIFIAIALMFISSCTTSSFGVIRDLFIMKATLVNAHGAVGFLEITIVSLLPKQVSMS